MKQRMMFLLVVLLVLATTGTAQEKLSKAEWETQIQQYTSERDNLKAQLAALTKEVDGLRSTLASLNGRIKSVRDETLALTGASDATRKEFEHQLTDLEQRVASLQALSDQDLYVHRFDVDSVQALKDNLMKQRIAEAERYYLRLQALQGKIDGLRSTLAKIKSVAESEEHYVVRSWAKYRDCLWNISKKKKIYDSPFLWPKIWQANRDQIKDPDIIRVGEHLKIPAPAGLTTAEKDAEREYWSKRHT